MQPGNSLLALPAGQGSATLGWWHSCVTKHRDWHSQSQIPEPGSRCGSYTWFGEVQDGMLPEGV